MNLYTSLAFGARALSTEIGYMLWDKNQLKVLPRVQYDNNPDSNFKHFKTGEHKITGAINTSVKLSDKVTWYNRPEITYAIKNKKTDVSLDSAMVIDKPFCKRDRAIIQAVSGYFKQNAEQGTFFAKVRPFYKITFLNKFATRFDVELGINSKKETNLTLGHKIEATISRKDKPWWGTAIISSFPITDNKIDYAGSYFWTGRCMNEINPNLFLESGVWIGRNDYEESSVQDILVRIQVKMKLGPENRWWP